SFHTKTRLHPAGLPGESSSKIARLSGCVQGQSWGSFSASWTRAISLRRDRRPQVRAPAIAMARVVGRHGASDWRPQGYNAQKKGRAFPHANAMLGWLRLN
ncbi:unnamed protein product, partial [Amoebophrya sp. A25]